jgi:hypothetical protein
MRRLLAVHHLAPGAVDAHHAWCEELRRRRDEFAESRLALRICRQVFWLQPVFDLAIVRTDAEDPVTALGELARSTTPFDRWYAQRERDIHGRPLLPAGQAPPELLSDRNVDEIDAFDLFVATAIPVLPGRTEAFRRDIADSVRSGAGRARLERWQAKRLAVWLQSTDRGDVVVYEAAGDVPHMLRSLTTDDDPDTREQRALVQRTFGLDVARTSYPIPEPAFAWSTDEAPVGL